MVSLELIQIFSQLQFPTSRQDGLHALAAHLNIADAFLFGKDEEIGALLPAQGLPQTLPHGAKWQAFIKKCAAEKLVKGTLPSPRGGAELSVFGMGDQPGLAVLIFFCNEFPEEIQAQVASLLPLVGAKLADERRAQSAAGHAAAARAASEHARSLNIALDTNRRDLQKAFATAEKELAYRREAEKKLRQADRKKDEFLAMLAHELRNPLAPIKMAAQIIKLPSTAKDQIDKASAVIDRQVKHMTSLLDDLLDVSRVTRGQIALEKKPIEIKTVIAEAIEQVRTLVEERGHELSLQLTHEPAQVEGARTRLVQILANLLNNAAKYTPKGGKISLRLDVSAKEIIFSVKDNGIGINPSLLPQVFELFTQAERTSDRSQGGLGIGLALVKSLVELHSGTVTAHSLGSQGMGSEFTVRLPRLTKALTSPSDAQATNLPLTDSPLNILVVDDNADAADTLAAFLGATGHKTQVAYHAQDAIALASTMALNVFILDIGLPDIDGHQLARAIRAMPQMGDAILIALTGYGQPNDQENALAAGFDHHFIKPADPVALTQLLSEISKEIVSRRRTTQVP